MNNHLILSCHEDDYQTMATLLAGMEAHSDFVTADMNELWRMGEPAAQQAVVSTMGPKPKREAWHGFTFPNFPWKTLLSLLESASWYRVERIGIVYLMETEIFTFNLPKFSQVINKNLLK